MNNLILFFETYSIIQTLLLFKYIRKATLIYFHKKSFPPLNQNPKIKAIVEVLIYLYNKHVKIETLPADKINEHNWVMNKKAIDVVENLTDDINNSAIYRTILAILKDENILKCYKMQLVDYISARLLFFRIAKDLIEDHKDSIYLVPSENNNSRIQKIFGNESLNPYILPGSIIANRIRNLFLKIYALIIFLLLPSAYIILNLKKITLRKINKKSYDIAMPVIWGFHEGDVMIDGVKRQQDDGYLYNGKITPGHIIHIFGSWRRSPDVEKRYKENMDKKGIHYIDKNNYKIGLSFIEITLKIQFLILWHFLINFFYKNEKRDYAWYSNLIINWMLKKFLEFENIDYKVEFMRHDYSPNHIVETILCNQNNKKTIGIQHQGVPEDLPNLCWIHMNKYLVFGEIYIKRYHPFWEKIQLEKVGRENIDWVVDIKKNKDGLLNELKSRIHEKYKERKYTVLILLPSKAEYNLKKQWDEMYNALYEIKTINTDMNLFLRFRSTKDTYSGEYLNRFRDLCKLDKRIIIDHENFTTYELIALSDLVIANSASFSVYEALAAGAKVFTFDFIGTSKFFFPECGKDFILYNKEDLKKAFKGLNNNFEDFDCNWELIKRQGIYYYDGKNLKRIQQVVLNTLEEVNTIKIC